MAYLDIHKAMTQSVIDMGLLIPIAHENTNFDPETQGGDSYISVNVLYDEQNTVTKTGLDDVNGFLQITSYVKSGSSVGAMYDLADKITERYYHAAQFDSSSSGQVVNIQNIAVNKRGNQNGWYVTDYSVYFWSDIGR